MISRKLLLLLSIFFSFILLSIFYFLFSHSVSAANNPRIYFETAVKQVAPSSEFTVKILLDAPQPINAIDVDIDYSQDTLELISLNNSKSIIDFWQGGPQNLSAEKTVNLRGGSIDPFTGSGGKIITLNFRAKKEGRANLSFAKSNLYYADGKGTRADNEPAASLNISIIEGVKIESFAEEAGIIEDKIPPIIETAKVALAPIDKSRLAVFQATDDSSGIKMTEIRFRQLLSWSDWQTVTNPVRLPSTAWTFQIKATDNAGNASEKTVYVPQAFLNLGIPILALLTLIIAIRLRRRSGRNKATPGKK